MEGIVQEYDDENSKWLIKGEDGEIYSAYEDNNEEEIGKRRFNFIWNSGRNKRRKKSYKFESSGNSRKKME